MKKRVAVLATAALIAGLGVILPSPAEAAEVCDESHFGDVILTSLVVPDDAVCQLYNTYVGGSITVKPGGTLLVESGGQVSGDPSHITGSIDSLRGQVYVQDSKVDGSVTLVRSRYWYGTNEIFFPPAALLCGNRIGGTVIVRDTPDTDHGVDIGLCQVCYVGNSRPPSCWDEANGNLIGGSLRVIGNRELVRVYFNTIGGSVVCRDNNPDPEYGPNTVGGSVSGECA